jgi:hypothetical protein
MRTAKSKWSVITLAVALGVLMLGIQWAAGHRDRGLVSLGIMSAFAAVLLLGGRSDAVRELRGEDRDERVHEIQLRAIAFAGRLVIVAVVIGSIVEIARGHDVSPYTWLASLGGFSYLGAVLVLRNRI